MLNNFLELCGAISVVTAAIGIFYKGYRLLAPARASISYTLNFDGTKPDSLSVTVTNRSTGPIYVRTCKVRCTYSFLALLRKHLHKPFLSPNLYSNLRYNSTVYELVGKEPIKLESGQLVELKRNIYEHPLHALYGPMLIAFVELTSGRVVRSRRMPSPPVWRTIGRRGRACL
jgi:hypothetical protein